MSQTISASFDDPTLADRALARLRQAGIPIYSFRVRSHRARQEPSLFVADPFGSTTRLTEANALTSALPLTSGNSLMMRTPFFSDQPEGRSVLTVMLDGRDLPQARAILHNCGGLEVRAR